MSGISPAAAGVAGGPLVAAGSGPSPLWYATRATGVMALVLLTATVVLGVAGTARFATPRWPRVITSGLHRNLSLLVVCFLAVHILTALADTYAPIGWASVLVPFASAYRPLWLGLGTVASDLVLALVITSLLRVRLGRRAWRAVHWLAYVAWPVALWHGLGTGTDATLPWLLGIDAACMLAAALALWWRLTRVDNPVWRRGGVTAGLVLPVLTVAFAAAGPLRPGWALRAGTPAALLGHAAPAAGPPSVAGRDPGSRRPASAPFDGTLTQSTAAGTGQVILTVSARARGTVGQRIVITLRGTPDGGGGITLSSGTVTVSPTGSGGGFEGPVTSLRGNTMVAELAGPGEYRARARIVVSISGSTVTGRLEVTGGGDA